MYIPGLRLTYNGLGKIPALKKYVRNIRISSGYKSTYVVGGYTSNVLFVDEDKKVMLSLQKEILVHYIITLF